VTSSLDVFEAAIWIESMYMINDVEISEKKEKIWKSKKFSINLHLKNHLQMEFTAC